MIYRFSPIQNFSHVFLSVCIETSVCNLASLDLHSSGEAGGSLSTEYETDFVQRNIEVFTCMTVYTNVKTCIISHDVMQTR